ncbi:MAG: histidine triad nucleotide-binding protein [Candidatus Omnitrophica bacterium]|nr:histidine triad nucleotide-binding protein [Candidatus Omnitrophota bacterium]
MEDCIFCGLASGRIECAKVYEDDKAIAFRDINPQAPVHILIVPKKHLVKLHDAKDPLLLGGLMEIASKLAVGEGIAETGYRVVINTGRDAGQSVEHLHVHLLGGRNMKWPPG